MTRNGVNPRLTIEVLAQDCLDVRELYKAGVLDGEWVTFRWPEIRWPAVRKMSPGHLIPTYRTKLDRAVEVRIAVAQLLRRGNAARLGLDRRRRRWLSGKN
jgi:hypothetical protein